MTNRAEEPGPRSPSWRADASEQVLAYRQGLDLLASSLEFALERLISVELTSDELSGAGGRAVLPILAARGIGTVDAIHAVLAVGRVEQAEMLVRTLIDLQADAFLLAHDERAFGYYRDWATVEQARQALQMRPEEIRGAGRDLHTRQAELANELVARLADVEPETARNLAGRPLHEVVPAFCRSRYGSRWPRSWRQGFITQMGWSVEEVRGLIIDSASTVLEAERAPEQMRTEFARNFERELELLFGYLSGEIHNSPLTMNRLIDHRSWTIRLHGDIDGLPRSLAAAFQHLLRVMILFEHEWNPPAPVESWSERAVEIAEWLERV